MSKHITPTVEAIDGKVLAQAIVNIDTSMRTLLNSGLRKNAIITLLADHTGIGKREITKVLEGLSLLRVTYTTLPAEDSNGMGRNGRQG